MTLRKSLLFLSFGLALVGSRTLLAQVTEANANPAHEKIKTEADSFYKQGEYQKAIDLTTQVIKQNPKDDVAFYLRGSAKVDMGIRSNNAQMVREGIADAREAITINGQTHTNYYLPYLQGMSNLTLLEGRKDHAETALQVASQVLNLPNIKEDQKANVLYHKGRTQTMLGKHAEAAQDYEQALQFDSMHLGSFLGAAQAYAAAGNTAKAEQQFNRAITTFPNHPIVHNERGKFRQERGQFDQALADFTRVIELKSDAYYAYTNRGFTLMQQGNHQAAESEFDQSLKMFPNQPMVYSLRGTVRLAQGQLAEAVADYQKVVQLDPNNPVAKGDLGFALFFQENYAAAAQQFEAATKANKELKHLHSWHLVAVRKSQPQVNYQQKFAPLIETDPQKANWADMVLGYQLGKVTEEQLLAGPGVDNAEVSKALMCEAYFFIGHQKALEGNAQAAAESFRKATETKVSHLSAYRGSEIALKRLNVATSSRTLR
jgi:lipoprotein NlpI